MTTSFVDSCYFNANNSGTGDFSVANNVTGWLTPAQANCANGATYRYRAATSDQSEWESGLGTYYTANTTLDRTTITASSASNTRVSFSSNPKVALTMGAEDFQPTLGYTPVNKAGDTISGTLQVNNYLTINGTNATPRALYFDTEGALRWQLSTDTIGETGNNIGSNFIISCYDDSGNWISNPIYIQRNTGETVFNDTVSVANSLTVSGTLTISEAAPVISMNKTTVTDTNIIQGLSNGVGRWGMYFGDGSTESGNNTGSNFSIVSYADDGSYLATPIGIGRDSPQVNFGGNIWTVSNITANGSVGSFNNMYITPPGNTTAAFSFNFTGANTANPKGKIWSYVNGNTRWALILGNSTAESGNNVGSDFSINRYDDSGNDIDSPIIINRDNGVVSFSNNITAYGGVYDSNTSNRVYSAANPPPSPSFTTGTTTPTITEFSNATCFVDYTIVGNRILFNGEIYLSNVNSTSSIYYISIPLPFTPIQHSTVQGILLNNTTSLCGLANTDGNAYLYRYDNGAITGANSYDIIFSGNYRQT